MLDWSLQGNAAALRSSVYKLNANQNNLSRKKVGVGLVIARKCCCSTIVCLQILRRKFMQPFGLLLVSTLEAGAAAISVIRLIKRTESSTEWEEGVQKRDLALVSRGLD